MPLIVSALVFIRSSSHRNHRNRQIQCLFALVVLLEEMAMEEEWVVEEEVAMEEEWVVEEEVAMEEEWVVEETEVVEAEEAGMEAAKAEVVEAETAASASAASWEGLYLLVCY